MVEFVLQIVVLVGAGVSLFAAGMAIFYLRQASKAEERFEEWFEEYEARRLKIVMDCFDARSEALADSLRRNNDFIRSLERPS